MRLASGSAVAAILVLASLGFSSPCNAWEVETSTFYEIWRSEDASTMGQLLERWHSGTSFADTTALANKSYYYRIRGYRATSVTADLDVQGSMKLYDFEMIVPAAVYDSSYDYPIAFDFNLIHTDAVAPVNFYVSPSIQDGDGLPQDITNWSSPIWHPYDGITGNPVPFEYRKNDGVDFYSAEGMLGRVDGYCEAKGRIEVRNTQGFGSPAALWETPVLNMPIVDTAFSPAPADLSATTARPTDICLSWSPIEPASMTQWSQPVQGRRLPAADIDGMFDTFEDLSVIDAPVTSRQIGGVIVDISTSGDRMTARSYDSRTPVSFAGRNDTERNVPAYPENVSGSWFISAARHPSGMADDQPIVFDFSTPVSMFGFTTLDLLEEDVSNDSSYSLKAYDDSGALIDEHAITGRQGPSGVDVDWQVSSDIRNIVRAVFEGQTNVGGCYGIDDMFVVGPEYLTGDFNMDGTMNGLDIPGFKEALADEAGWEAVNGVDADELGDFNGDGAFNGLDIPGFKDALALEDPAVPEPATISLLALAALCVLKRKP